MVGGPAPASGKSHRSVDGDLRLSCTDLAAHSEELTLEGASQAPVEGLYHPRTRGAASARPGRNLHTYAVIRAMRSVDDG
jgi:hypothetical protein